MLIVHPSSTCDVCLEPYNGGGRTPDVIPCGHVFCHSCLESLTRLACPMCRYRFQPHEVRKLHIDPAASSSPAGAVQKIKMSSEVRKFLDVVHRFIRDGAPQPCFRQLANDIMEWSKFQPPDQFEEMRVIMRLLMSVDLWFNKAHKLESDLRRANSSIQEGNVRIETAERELRQAIMVHQEEKDAAECRYQDLLSQSQDEKDTALAVETSLREHLANVNQRIDELIDENARLREHAQFAGFDIQQLKKPVGVSDIQVPDIEVTLVVGKDDDHKTKELKPSKGSLEPVATPATNRIPFLSPLPLAVSISSPVSSFITFAPLPKDDVDVTLSYPQDSLVTCPSPIGEPGAARPALPIQPSGLSRTRPSDIEPSANQESVRTPLPPPANNLSRGSSPRSSAVVSRSPSLSPGRGTENHSRQNASSGETVQAPRDSLDVDEAEAERSRARQLQEILSSPLPNSAHLSIVDLRRKVYDAPNSATVPDISAVDIRPRVRQNSSERTVGHDSGELPDRAVPDSRSRAHSDASLSRPETVPAYSHSHSVASPAISSLAPRSEAGILKHHLTELRPRAHSERSAARPHVSPPRPTSSPMPLSQSIPTRSFVHAPPTSSTSSTPSNVSYVRPVLNRDISRQVVSTASLAALEQERRKAEKERGREKEREQQLAGMNRSRELQQDRTKGQPAASNLQTLAGSSVYNSPAPSLYRSMSTSLAIGNGKGKTNMISTYS